MSNNNPIGVLPNIEQPWGFDGVRRETRGAYGDSRAFYVNPNHIEATDDNSGEDPAHPLATIQRAVTLSRSMMGDVIYVMQNDGWIYGSASQNPVTESVTIPLDKHGIKLIGVGAGGMGVNWRPAAANGVCLTILGIDVSVENFSFFAPAGGDGISCLWGSPTSFGENTIIKNCTFAGVDIGIILEYAWYVKILDCHFDECDEFGIYVDPAGDGIAKCTIKGNWFQDCAVAMQLDEAEECLITENMIYNANAQGAAVATNEGINTAGGARNMVTANFFSCLLPVPANGDYDDLNSASATDAWVGNLCLNGSTVGNPT